MIRKVVFATQNKHKLNEIRSMLGNTIELIGLKELGFDGEIPENQDTIEGNAMQKALFVFDRYKWPCFADDTGLEIEYLNGAPGVYSARYAGPACNSEDNIDKVLTALQGIKSRTARFRCVIAFVSRNEQKLFTGIVRGRILESRKGTGGFGYDPIFLPDGYTQSFAEMPLDEKNKISHRAKAFSQLRNYLLGNTP